MTTDIAPTGDAKLNKGMAERLAKMRKEGPPLEQMARNETPVPLDIGFGWRVVDDEYRTGLQKPDWWETVEGGATVFVESTTPPRAKDAVLREYARREGYKLHTRRGYIDGEPGTFYWMTFPQNVSPEQLAEIEMEDKATK